MLLSRSFFVKLLVFKAIIEHLESCLRAQSQQQAVQLPSIRQLNWAVYKNCCEFWNYDLCFIMTVLKEKFSGVILFFPFSVFLGEKQFFQLNHVTLTFNVTLTLRKENLVQWCFIWAQYRLSVIICCWVASFICCL